ncbi:MAG: hypothetical protein K9J13_13310 [Saprospiraceae bacterium]|nr:hypothetical protein [Saprospiraceae bacterium]
MQKRKFQILIILIFFQLSVYSQFNNSSKKDSIYDKKLNPFLYGDIIKTNPLPIIWGVIPFTSEYKLIYEMVTQPKQSISLGASYLGKTILWDLFQDTTQTVYGQPEIKISGYRVQGMYKFYFTNKYAPRGLFIGPHISYSSAKYTYQQTQINYNYLKISHFNVNCLIGYQDVIFDLISIELFVGAGYKNNIWEEHKTKTNFRVIKDNDMSNFYNSHQKFMAGFNIGVAF